MPRPNLPGLKTLGCVHDWGAEGGLGLQPPQASPPHVLSLISPTHSRERERDRGVSAGFTHHHPENALKTILLSRTVFSWGSRDTEQLSQKAAKNNGSHAAGGSVCAVGIFWSGTNKNVFF